MSPAKRAPKPVSKPQRRHLTRVEVVAAAIAIVDESGADALTTTAVARRLHVTQPAIYTHVASLDELRAEVARHGIEELSHELREATEGLSGDDALFALAIAYRKYVARHPARYLLQLSTGGSEQLLRVSERAAEPARQVLRSYGLDEAHVRFAHAAMRAAIHGFVHLEARGAMGSGNPVDEAFAYFIELLRNGLHYADGPPPTA